MGQEKIWDYFQNEGIASFDEATPRYTFIARRVAAQVPAGSRVLDIGVGSGELALMLLSRGFAVSALDPNRSAIERLRREGVDGQVGVAEKLPFENGNFDCVIASEVLEHLDPPQCDVALAEIRRVLSKAGLFVGTVPFNEVLEGARTVCPECGHRFHRWGHRQSFDRDGLNRRLRSEFEVTWISVRAFVSWAGGPRRFLKSLGKWLLARLGEPVADPHLYFECRPRV